MLTHEKKCDTLRVMHRTLFVIPRYAASFVRYPTLCSELCSLSPFILMRTVPHPLSNIEPTMLELYDFKCVPCRGMLQERASTTCLCFDFFGPSTMQLITP